MNYCTRSLNLELILVLHNPSQMLFPTITATPTMSLGPRFGNDFAWIGAPSRSALAFANYSAVSRPKLSVTASRPRLRFVYNLQVLRKNPLARFGPPRVCCQDIEEDVAANDIPSSRSRTLATLF